MPVDTTTRERLLDAAERLFAEQGVARTSLRQLTAEAGANLAAVHYHFGSKLELVRAVFERRLDPLNAERLQRLAAAQAAAGDGPVPLREILVAFLEPALRFGQGPGSAFFTMIARAHVTPDPGMRQMIAQAFQQVAESFGGALQRTLPDVPRPELLWRMHFVVGALCHTVVNTKLLEEFLGGAVDDGPERVLERLLDFAEGGLVGPARGAS